MQNSVDVKGQKLKSFKADFFAALIFSPVRSCRFASYSLATDCHEDTLHSTFFHIRKLTDTRDWLALLWFTGESAGASRAKTGL